MHLSVVKSQTRNFKYLSHSNRVFCTETDIAKIEKKQRKQWRPKGKIPIFRKAPLNQQTIKLPRNKT